MGHRIRIENQKEGTSILQALQAQGEYILAPCGGNGTCGKCRVRFVQDPPAPSQAGRKVLTEAEIAAGVRLACRTAAVNGAVIEIEAGDEKQMDVASGFALKKAPVPGPAQEETEEGDHIIRKLLTKKVVIHSATNIKTRIQKSPQVPEITK